jgi:ABC-type oligopeptide transport system substrate-binding subunit
MYLTHKRTLALIAGLALLILNGCRAKPQIIEKPVPQTVTVIQTVTAAQTVVVTATPIPTPAYTARYNAPASTLVYPLPALPNSLDAIDINGSTNKDEAARFVLQQIDEGLFNLRANGEAVPAAAEGYQTSSDLKTYTVTLRAGLQWSDGQPVIAQQYADAICRTLDPATGNRAADVLAGAAHLHGAADYAGGAAPDCRGVGIHALDARRLQLDLDQPVGFLPQLLAYPAILPFRADSSAGSVAEMQGRPASLLTNGPYTLGGWTPAGVITLAKNPHYWNAANVHIDRIELRAAPDAAQQLALYEQGDLAVSRVPASAMPRIQAQPAFNAELHILPQPGVSFLGLNTQITPTANVNVRRAVASALDRAALARLVTDAPAPGTSDAAAPTAAQDLWPPELWPGGAASAPNGYPYDPAAARQFLAQAGYSTANPPPPVAIWYNREGNNPALFEAIAQMLEAVGIPTRLVSSSWGVYTHALETCRTAAADKTSVQCGYHLYWTGWTMNYADATSLLAEVLAPQSALQYTGWGSAEYEGALAQGIAAADPAQRITSYRAAEKIVLNEAVAFVPLLRYNRAQLIKAGVQFEYPPFGPPNLQYWVLR